MMLRFPVLLAAAALAGCAEPPPLTEGFIPVPGGRIWYARMGNGPGTPLIVIHGGPGSTSYGLKPWAVLGNDRPVIRYDQLGSGKADHPTDTTLFTVERAVQELQALRDSLGLERVHLYGRSWGAMLVEAYLGTNPEGVESVVLSSPLVTTAQWERDADSLIRTLPRSAQRAIARNEAAHTTDSPEYRAAMAEYYKRYVTRHPPRSPADADSARRSRGDLVYRYMWGPSEFTATGTLKSFDATEWLRNIEAPTLFLAGEFDEATPASTERFSKLVPGAEFQVIKGAAHATENDNPQALLRIVRAFLRRVDSLPPGGTPGIIGAWRSTLQFASGILTPIKDLQFMYVFNPGGTMTESSNYDQAPPVPPAYGIWRALGPGRFEARYLFFTTNPPKGLTELVGGQGWLPAGHGVLTEDIRLSPDGLSFESSISLELFDTAGKPVAGGGTATNHGRRIAFPSGRPPS